MALLEWICEKTPLTLYAKTHDGVTYFCKAQKHDCKYSSCGYLINNEISKREHICNKNGILKRNEMPHIKCKT